VVVGWLQKLQGYFYWVFLRNLDLCFFGAVTFVTFVTFCYIYIGSRDSRGLVFVFFVICCCGGGYCLLRRLLLLHV